MWFGKEDNSHLKRIVEHYSNVLDVDSFEEKKRGPKRFIGIVKRIPINRNGFLPIELISNNFNNKSNNENLPQIIKNTTTTTTKKLNSYSTNNNQTNNTSTNTNIDTSIYKNEIDRFETFTEIIVYEKHFVPDGIEMPKIESKFLLTVWDVKEGFPHQSKVLYNSFEIDSLMKYFVNDLTSYIYCLPKGMFDDNFEYKVTNRGNDAHLKICYSGVRSKCLSRCLPSLIVNKKYFNQLSTSNHRHQNKRIRDSFSFYSAFQNKKEREMEEEEEQDSDNELFRFKNKCHRNQSTFLNNKEKNFKGEDFYDDDGGEEEEEEEEFNHDPILISLKKNVNLNEIYDEKNEILKHQKNKKINQSTSTTSSSSSSWLKFKPFFSTSDGFHDEYDGEDSSDSDSYEEDEEEEENEDDENNDGILKQSKNMFNTHLIGWSDHQDCKNTRFGIKSYDSFQSVGD